MYDSKHFTFASYEANSRPMPNSGVLGISFWRYKFNVADHSL